MHGHALGSYCQRTNAINFQSEKTWDLYILRAYKMCILLIETSEEQLSLFSSVEMPN